jgi:hypothetical protein
MDILLIVATLAVAAAGLYVAATFNRRTRQHTAPLIDGAVKEISGRVDETAAELRRQLKAMAGELQRDRDQIRLDGRKIQGRLDHADSRITSIANQLMAELETVRRLAERLGADLRELDHTVTQLGGSPLRSERAAERTVVDMPLAPLAAPPTAPPAAPPAGPATAVVPGRLYAERLRFALVRTQPEPGALVRILLQRCVAELPDPRLGDLGDATAIVGRAEHDEGFRARLGEAAAGYFGAEGPEPAAAAERWITPDAFPEMAAAEVTNRLGNALDAIVERPLAESRALTGLQPAAAAGPSEQVTAFLEITGAVVGVLAGLRPLALGGTATLVQDRFHDSLARGLVQAAHRVFGGPAPEPPSSWWEP